MNFIKFRDKINLQVELMAREGTLFVVDVDKDELWDLYLDSFDETDNPLYKERTQHDCNCCKNFIRDVGAIVQIVDNKLISIWDVTTGDNYQQVVDALAERVKSRKVANVFLTPYTHKGAKSNFQYLDDSGIKQWDHFYYNFGLDFIGTTENVASEQGKMRDNATVLQRSLKEITVEAVDTVLELIEQKSIYRGEEHKSIVQRFAQLQTTWAVLYDEERTNYCWKMSIQLKGASRVRNTVIGTLLADISDGMALDKAVAVFEAKVAPSNYKRPKALITQSMITKAEKKVQELGILDSLPRRFANIDDVTADNVLYLDRIVKKHLNVFGELADTIPVSVKNFDKVEEVGIDTFMEFIVPTAASIELFVANEHTNNFMSLIAPVNINAKKMFKWDNNFSWAYNGEVADSIKERVRLAGGNVQGVLRASLSWFNRDDLDIHVHEPGGQHIYFQQKRSASSGTLDVDMNAVASRVTRKPVENITWTHPTLMNKGVYVVTVKQYHRRETMDKGFVCELECAGKIYKFEHTEAANVGTQVVRFNFDGKDISIIDSLPQTVSTEEIWGLNTSKFHRVSMILNSPNHWDGKELGNKHLFFILDKCASNKPARGFFNEFLSNELTEHRKVFETLGAKMKTEVTTNQLSGLGFSSTQRNSILCRVQGSFSRVIRVNF